MATTTTRPHASSEVDRAVVAAGIGDARPLLRKAQRALERPRRVAQKHEHSEDEAAREFAGRILDLCRHVDGALALVEGE